MEEEKIDRLTVLKAAAYDKNVTIMNIQKQLEQAIKQLIDERAVLEREMVEIIKAREPEGEKSGEEK